MNMIRTDISFKSTNRFGTGSVIAESELQHFYRVSCVYIVLSYISHFLLYLYFLLLAVWDALASDIHVWSSLGDYHR